MRLDKVSELKKSTERCDVFVVELSTPFGYTIRALPKRARLFVISFISCWITLLQQTRYRIGTTFQLDEACWLVHLVLPGRLIVKSRKDKGSRHELSTILYIRVDSIRKCPANVHPPTYLLLVLNKHDTLNFKHGTWYLVLLYFSG